MNLLRNSRVVDKHLVAKSYMHRKKLSQSYELMGFNVLCKCGKSVRDLSNQKSSQIYIKYAIIICAVPIASWYVYSDIKALDDRVILIWALNIHLCMLLILKHKWWGLKFYRYPASRLCLIGDEMRYSVTNLDFLQC